LIEAEEQNGRRDQYNHEGGCNQSKKVAKGRQSSFRKGYGNGQRQKKSKLGKEEGRTLTDPHGNGEKIINSYKGKG